MNPANLVLDNAAPPARVEPSMSRPAFFRWPHPSLAAVWLLWLLIFGLIVFDLVRHPSRHNSTGPSREATLHWWANQDMYSTPENSGAAFFYLPQAAVLYTPFAYGPYLLGEILERAFGFSLLACGFYRIAQTFYQRGQPISAGKFLIFTALAVPCGLASLRNGQFDLTLAALILLTVADVAESRWIRAAFWLALGLALKPLMLVPLLLFGALYRPLWLRLGIGIALVLLLPFLNPDWPYVIHEHARFIETLQWAYHLKEERFSELGGMLEKFGWTPPHEFLTAARAGFALLFLGLGWLSLRRLPRAEAAWLIGALSALYLMLFNPRTETCSYIFLGPFLASLALYLPARQRPLAVALGLGTLALANDAISATYPYTNIWLKPFVALLFLPVLIYFLKERPGISGTERAAHG